MSTNAEIEVEDEQATASGGRKLDPELRVIGAVLRLLDELTPRSRGRVVTYLSDRHMEDHVGV